MQSCCDVIKKVLQDYHTYIYCSSTDSDELNSHTMPDFFATKKFLVSNNDEFFVR